MTANKPPAPSTRPDGRPDPDALLALTAREGLGRLKVFLGAAPGVGKTFEMLTEAHRRRAAGADVLAGIIETHGRAETTTRIGDLEVLPRARIEYRGQVLEEFDLDGALARRPAILLLDELAHTNAPGSRHPKRWQDAEELRQAGVEVWATMNVQHLESLSDTVARITGVRVQETVPDRVLAEADEVELIDIPPGELLERLRGGKVYRPDQAERALRGFFREGNLAALREIALRRTAEHVDADVTGYMRANRIAGPWPAGDRVLVLIGAGAAQEGAVRQARRIADALHAPLLALHVERPNAPESPATANAMRLAESLGAATETVMAGDLVAAILVHARQENCTHIVIARGRPAWWRRLTGRTLSATLLRQATDFSLHLVPDPAVTAPRQPRRADWAGPPRWFGWMAVPVLVGLATLVGHVTDGVVPEGSLGMVYLAAIVASATAFGPLHGIAAAVLSFLLWNYLFLPPRYTLAIAGPQDIVGMVVFAAVALMLTGTTGGVGRSMRAARARLFGLRRLVEFARKLGGPQGSGDLVIIVAQEAERVAGCPACVLRPLDGEPVLRAAAPLEAEPDEGSLAAARWAMEQGRRTGFGTDTLPAAAWQFRPMRTVRGVAGLLGLNLAARGTSLDPERDRTLDALLDQAAVALERAELIEEQARGTARAETEALRTALLTSLGHDLRTPLTAIRGAAETLRLSGDRLPGATRDDLLITVEEEAARMARFLSNILDIVRLENGHIVPRREPVDLADAAEAAIARAERATGRVIRREFPTALAEPRLDPSLLDQILGNLLDNALKYSGRDGAVVLRLWRDGAEAAIAVEDDGPGIPPEHLVRIFDPFFRATRTDRVVAGTGLGLAICRGMAHAMGGRIAAESPVEPDGRGTRMTLRFPV